jgi:Na+(H+)/acetate symporter ActP
MKIFKSKTQSLVVKSMSVLFAVIVILVISLCASVIAVIYMHADKKGMVPSAFSLSDHSNFPVITLIPPAQIESSRSTEKKPLYDI